jgi:truncated hemoglobin YjbI
VPDIEIEFRLTHSYHRRIDKDEFISWMRDTFRDKVPDDPDLDELYNLIDSGDQRAMNFVIDLAQGDKYWLDTVDHEMTDLRDARD